MCASPTAASPPDVAPAETAETLQRHLYSSLRLHVMASGAIPPTERDFPELSNSSLLDLLSNSLLLRETTPFLPISTLLNLAATSKALHNLLYKTPGVFRHVDITSIKSAHFDVAGIDHGGEIWRNVQLDENLTEDEFYSGPLRGIFYHLGKSNILQDVQTLVLDGLSVTADLVNDILIDPKFHVRILSIREAKNLNEHRFVIRVMTLTS